MKRIILISLLLFAGRLLAQTPFDGPYVRYANGQIDVTIISKDDDLLIPKTTNYNSKNITLDVVPEGHPEWAFKVKLRDTLVNDEVNYPMPSKCLFMSDIEGEFANFRRLLIAAKVIDTAYNWTYGTGSLVIPGDLFDRGKDVVPELWLLYNLEDEARGAGGRAIIINGNHDIMNLSGDHRYTDSKYFKDAWLLHTDINGLFGKHTELGRWLRTKNLIVKVGNVLVMHGGLSPAILQKHLSLNALNVLCRPWYDVPRKQTPDSLQVFFGKDALFWYRGYFMGTRATVRQVDSTLTQYGCKYILVGHTIIRWNIARYYGGKVIGVDVDEHAGHTEAALYEDGKWYTLDEDGKKQDLRYQPANDAITNDDIL